jgi:hypothetical protein
MITLPEGTMAKEEMTISERYKYLRMMQERYRSASRAEKAALLDEMETMTGLHRKYLVGRMHCHLLVRQKRRRERQRVYDEEVIKVLTELADTLDWICAERLQPTLRKTAEHRIKLGVMSVTPAVLAKLEHISVATVGRLLKEVRPTDRLPRAHPGRHAENSAQRAVPQRIIACDVREPGHFEVDLVHHGAPDQEGRVVCTFQAIDVLTGWSERFAIMGWEFDAIWQVLQAFKRHCPIPIREVHSDNGGEFINAPLIAVFGKEMPGVEQTRGRPGNPNDSRFVEQKNDSLVRAYLGSVPLHTVEQRNALNRLYEDMWLYYNFFQPVLRQTERTAVKGPDGITRIRRKQDRAHTPLERLLEAKPPISRETRERLQALYDQTDPLALKRRIHAQIKALIAMSTQEKQEEAGPV